MKKKPADSRKSKRLLLNLIKTGVKSGPNRRAHDHIGNFAIVATKERV